MPKGKIDKNCVADVIIVGGGLSGCSAAYHLTKAGKNRLVLLGGGNADHEVEVSSPKLPGNEEIYKTGVSGTAGVGAVKMVVTQPPCSISEFVAHHTEKGAKLYLHMSSSGVALEKQLAQQFSPGSCRSLGSLCVAFPHQVAEMEADYALYRSLGVDVQLFDQKKVEEYHGSQAGFVRGLFFPNDAIIHSANFAKALLVEAKKTGKLKVREQCGRVVRADDVPVHGSSKGDAVVMLESGEKLRAHFAVLATGGLFLPQDLSGILRPCWSYFTYVSAPSAPDVAPRPHPNSPNFFTHDFSHDWCVTDGEVRISGEDHFSALKPPRTEDRCLRLEKWLRERYPSLPAGVLRKHYGIYSETPDALPIVGLKHKNSSVCYLLGCNAWGQSILTYCSSLIPGIIDPHGTKVPALDQELSDFISPQRFSGRGKL